MKVQDQRQGHQDSKKPLTHATGLQILSRFYTLSKLARIYEPNNLMYVKQAKSLFDLIQQALGGEGQAHLMLRESSLFFNRVRLKFGFSNYHIFKQVVNELRLKDIGSISFSKSVSEEGLKQFMYLLANIKTETASPLEEFSIEMKARGIENISLEETAQADTSTPEKSTDKVYFLGIQHLKEVFEQDKKGEKISVNITKRLMQSLFNHIVENESFVYGLTNIKNYDEYTLNHSVNVCALSIATGRRLGLDRNELVDLGISAFFHDFGKLDVPLEILNKPAKLSSEEMVVIERHPHQGAYRIVQERRFRKVPIRALRVALEHHMREDLTGYPKIYRKKSVNLYSKIVKIADFFDAITTKRIYREKVFTREEAVSLMQKKSGTEFHPLILKVFVNTIGAYPVGSLVALNLGEVGIVFETNPETHLMLRPKVKIIADAEGNRIDGEVIDLSEVDPETNRYKKTIAKVLNPDEYGIKVSDYFLAEAS